MTEPPHKTRLAVAQRLSEEHRRNISEGVARAHAAGKYGSRSSSKKKTTSKRSPVVKKASKRVARRVVKKKSHKRQRK